MRDINPNSLSGDNTANCWQTRDVLICWIAGHVRLMHLQIGQNSSIFQPFNNIMNAHVQ